MVSIKGSPRGFRVRPVCFVFLLSVMCWPARAQAPGDPVIELRASIAAALQRSGTLQASAASERAATEDAVVAAQRPDPVLRLSLDNLPLNGPDRWSITRDFMTMRSIGVMQTLPSQRKRQVRAQRFEREADAARLQRLMQAADVQQQTAVAWFELHAAQQRLALLGAQRDEAQRQVLAAEAAARAGRGSQTAWIEAQEAAWRLEQMGIQTEAEQRDRLSPRQDDPEPGAVQVLSKLSVSIVALVAKVLLMAFISALRNNGWSSATISFAILVSGEVVL